MNEQQMMNVWGPHRVIISPVCVPWEAAPGMPRKHCRLLSLSLKSLHVQQFPRARKYFLPLLRKCQLCPRTSGPCSLMFCLTVVSHYTGRCDSSSLIMQIILKCSQSERHCLCSSVDSVIPQSMRTYSWFFISQFNFKCFSNPPCTWHLY